MKNPTDQIAAEATQDIKDIVSILARPEIDERVFDIIKSAIEKSVAVERERTAAFRDLWHGRAAQGERRLPPHDP